MNNYKFYETKETGILGLTECGREWIQEFMKEVCEPLKLQFETKVDKEHGNEEVTFSIKTKYGVECTLQYGFPKSEDLCLTFSGSDKDHIISLSSDDTTRKEKQHDVRCLIVENDPSHFLEILIQA